MKTFLLKILISLTFLVILNSVLFRVIKRNYIARYDMSNIDAVAYLMADSHGIPLGDTFEKYGVYNFSYASDAYTDMERKLQYLIENAPIERLYLTVDRHTLSPFRVLKNNNTRSVIYAAAESYANRFEYYKAKYLSSKVVFLNGDYISILKEMVMSGNGDDEEPLGVVSEEKSTWADLPMKDKMNSAENRLTSHMDYDEKSEELVETLQRIIKTCNEHSIELIGIKFPLAKLYNSMIGTANFNADSVFIANGLSVLDFTTEELWENDNYFGDQDHLNEEGGGRFAEMIFGKNIKE